MPYRKIQTFLLLGLAFMVSGCVQMKFEAWLNPDGRGKFKLSQELMFPDQKGPNATRKMTPEEQEKAGELDPQNFISHSKGVSHWKNLEGGLDTVDGRPRFWMELEGYFTDLRALRVGMKEMRSEGLGEFHLHWEGDRLVFDDPENILRSQKSIIGRTKGERQAYLDSLDNLSPEVWERSYTSQKQMFEQMEQKLAEIEQGNFTFIVHLPGKIKEVSGFKQVDENTISFTLHFRELFPMMREQLTSPEQFRAYAYSLGDPEKIRATAYRTIGLPNTPHYVEVERSNVPLFDFEAETKDLHADRFPE